MAYAASQLSTEGTTTYLEVGGGSIKGSPRDRDHAPSTSTLYYTTQDGNRGETFGGGEETDNGTTYYKDADGNSFIVIAQGTVPSISGSENHCDEATFLNIEVQAEHPNHYNGYVQNGVIHDQQPNTTILTEIQQGAYQTELQSEALLSTGGKNAGLTACKVEFIGKSTRKRKLHFKCEICQLKTGLAIEVPSTADVENFHRLMQMIEQDGKLGWSQQEIACKLADFYGKHICGFHAPGYWSQPLENDDQPPLLTPKTSFDQCEEIVTKRKLYRDRKPRHKREDKDNSPLL